MPRSRSRSPKRERRRSPERSRDRDRDRHRRHKRSRSRSKSRDKKSRSRSRDRRRRSRSRERRYDDRDRGRGGREFGRGDESDSEDETLVFQPIVKPQHTEEEIQSLPEEDQDLMRIMGFSGFDTTKDKQVVGNDLYAANIAKKRRYRQYMNRKGGFNRPLDFIA